MKRKIIILSIFVSILFVGLILTENIDWFDTSIYNKLMSVETPKVTNLFIILSDIIYLLILICFLFWIFFRNKRVSFLVSFNLGLSFIVSYILKELFKRTRPIGIALVVEHGYSMPSSHAMVSISFFGLLFYYIYKNFEPGKFKKFLLSFLLFYIFMIGISRIYLGVHYASDVLLGFTFGLIYLIIFVRIFEKELVFDKMK